MIGTGFSYYAAFLVAFAVAFLLGPLLIPLLRRLKFGQSVRESGPEAHRVKVGTPAMGGILFLAGLTVAVVVLFPGRQSILVLVVSLGLGAIGFVDDFLKAVRRKSLGLRAREKLLIQGIIGVVLSVGAQALGVGTAVRVPFTEVFLHLGFFWPFVVVFILVGTANAVNLTDGLDGLAGGLTIIALAFFVLVGNPDLSRSALALMGGLVGFLWFNLHPAKVFMGDTGSLALGGALAAIAVLSGTELYLPIIGGIFLVETLSVILQVFFFRWLGRRILRMSPLHHHFELAGWSERRVVVRFWLAGLALAIFGYLGWR